MYVYLFVVIFVLFVSRRHKALSAHPTDTLLCLARVVFTNPGDFNDQSWTPEYLPFVWLEYPNTGARERSVSLFPRVPG